MDTIGNGERSDKAAPSTLHEQLRDYAERLTLVAGDLEDAEQEDGDYEDSAFDVAVTEVNGLCVELLDAIGDHEAAAAVLRS